MTENNLNYRNPDKQGEVLRSLFVNIFNELFNTNLMNRHTCPTTGVDGSLMIKDIGRRGSNLFVNNSSIDIVFPGDNGSADNISLPIDENLTVGMISNTIAKLDTKKTLKHKNPSHENKGE